MRILDTVFVYKLKKGEKLAYHGRYHAHGNNEYELHFFIDGAGSFLSNSAKMAISANSLFLSGPHEFHSILPERVTRPLTYYAVLFSLSEAEDAELYLLLTNILHEKAVRRTTADTDRFLFEEIYRQAGNNGASFQKSAGLLLESILFRWFSDENPAATGLNGKSERKKSSGLLIQNSLKFMESNLEKNITMNDVAYRMNLSVEHFIRLFRTEMHMTPYQYYIRLKAEAAAAELVSSNLPVATIAEKYGFENRFHFSRVLKKCTGMPPAAYRNCYMQNEV